MVNLIRIFICGIIIGVLIAAPMGPSGMLVIQRTISRGRLSAFITGIGVGISDMFYCLLTGFCLSFVSTFIEKNQSLIEIFGSIVIITFALYLILRKPNLKLSKSGVSVGKSHYVADFIAGFGITIINPLIVLLIIGLYSRFHFGEATFFHQYLAGYSGIFVGGALWWLGLTTLIGIWRNKFTLRSMLRLNRTIGVALLLMACAGIYRGVTQLANRQIKSESDLKSTTIITDEPNSNLIEKPPCQVSKEAS